MKKSLLFGFIFFLVIGIGVILVFGSTTTKKGSLIEVNYEEITNKVNNKENFVLVISQSTCSHCATYRPKLQKIASDYGIDVYYIDYDKESTKVQEKFLTKFHLDGATPTTIFIKDGKEISKLNRLIGDLSETKVINQLKKLGFIEE